MSSNLDATPRYALSFTMGGLLANEAAMIVPVYTRSHDWGAVRAYVEAGNVLQSRTTSSTKRTMRALIPRLEFLNEGELHIVADGTSTERNHVMWIAACRRYELIGEFAEEVLRERFLTLAGTVTHKEYDSFYRAKAMWHDELDAVSPATYKKLRQVLFKMMIEAELLTVEGAIEPVLLSTRVTDCLKRCAPIETRFFPTGAI